MNDELEIFSTHMVYCGVTSVHMISLLLFVYFAIGVRKKRYLKIKSENLINKFREIEINIILLPYGVITQKLTCVLFIFIYIQVLKGSSNLIERVLYGFLSHLFIFLQILVVLDKHTSICNE